jgi:hypothetical protein
MEASTLDWACDGMANRNSPKLNKSRRFIGIDPFENESELNRAAERGAARAGWEAVPNG